LGHDDGIIWENYSIGSHLTAQRWGKVLPYQYILSSTLLAR
jgi:hypothetical protein